MKLSIINWFEAKFKQNVPEETKNSKKSSGHLRQVMVALGPLLLTINLGMITGYSAVLLPQLQSKTSLIKINQNQASWIASMAALPMAFGCIIGGYLMEKFGRKTAHILTSIPCLIGWLIIALATNLEMILIGRFLTGICGGLLGSTTGVYISETTEPKLRGFLLATISCAVALGLFLAHLIGTYFHWQLIAYIFATIPILSYLILIKVPESPAWLIKKQRKTRNEIEEIFYWLNGGFDDGLKIEFDQIWTKNQQNSEQTDYKTKLKTLKRPEFWKPLLIMVVFIVTNQWSGVNAITFYTISIIQQTLGDGLNEYLAMLIVDFIRLFMAIFACVLLKKLQRRTLALISGFGTFISLFILSLSAHFNQTHQSNYLTIILMIALVSYISFITIGFVPLPWAMMSEVFPLINRNVGSSVTSMMAFIAFFSVVKTNPTMFEQFGADGTFLVYGFVALIGTGFIWVYLPETKDRPLHEIEKIFKKEIEGNINPTLATVA